MLLSELMENVDEGMRWAAGRGSSEVVSFAVGARNGGWQSFAGIQLSSHHGTDVAVVSAGRGYYGDSGTTVTDFRLQVADFISRNGDIEVGLVDHGELLKRFDVVVDQDTDRDGNPIGTVLLLQAYMVKASFRP